MSKSRTVAERFWPKVNKTAACWLWTGALDPDGYGHINSSGATNRVRHSVHRWAYEQTVGPIPNGMHLDHLCRVRHCVRPDHLEPVTPRENVARSLGPAAHAVRTDTCIHGHSLADCYRNKGGNRVCRTCAIEGSRRRRLAAAGRVSVS